MADPELVEILKQGSEVWNRWREKQPASLLIDLRSADLRDTNLSSANLSFADLGGADLRGANLSFAYLRHAYLDGADLSGANLIGANLYNADLNDANLSDADLYNADLSDANLYNADLYRANLSGVDLSHATLQKAQVWGTIFASIDLRKVKGLVEMSYEGPCYVELHSVLPPQDGSVLHFLRGCGVPDEWIDDYRARMMHPIQYYSCFISYAHQDDNAAHRLHSDLQNHGVRCWFASHDMKIGDKIRPRIDEAIHLQDKLLLILSEYSVASDWVEHEVEIALSRERKEKRTILFPIRLDNAILEQEYTGWTALVQNERHIGDFTNWKDHDQYQVAFDRLLRDLKKERT